MILPDVFDPSKPHQCPRMHPNPLVCPCASCDMARTSAKSRAALVRAIAKNFAPTGSVMPIGQPVREDDTPKETLREKIERQKRERYLEREKEWQTIQANQSRYAEQREETLARRQVSFELGWMQSPVTQSQDELWANLFTSETKEEQKQYIKRCNLHLNEPVRQGEIVLLPTAEPTTQQQRNLLNEWIDQAQIASAELGKLLDEEVATLNRHFELFSHQLEQRIKTDGLPTGYYAQVAVGVGATSAIVEQNLKNIQNVLLEINGLYVNHFETKQKVGYANSQRFFEQRAVLFKKLDGSFAMLSKRGVQLPIYTQIKRNLNLSTKSVVHNADEILKTGFVKELGKRIGNIALGITAARGVGYVGLLVGALSGVDSIYEACKIDGSGECRKTTAREVAGFMGGWYGGLKGGSAGVSLFVLAVGVTASAPVLALAAIVGAVVGGAIGGLAGSTTGKVVSDGMFFLYENADETLEEMKDML